MFSVWFVLHLVVGLMMLSCDKDFYPIVIIIGSLEPFS